MIFPIQILPFLLSLLYISTAFAFPQPPHSSIVRYLQPRADGLESLTLPTGWTVTTIRPSTLYTPIETACTALDILYTHVIAVARGPQTALSSAVAFQIGSFQLIFRTDEAILSWIMIEHFCERMLEDVRRGLPVEYEAVLTQDHFTSWVVYVNVRYVGKD